MNKTEKQLVRERATAAQLFLDEAAEQIERGDYGPAVDDMRRAGRQLGALVRLLGRPERALRPRAERVAA